jgi:hypothetical protein
LEEGGVYEGEKVESLFDWLRVACECGVTHARLSLRKGGPKLSWGYLFGAGAVLLFWVVSAVVCKGDLRPWALAVTDSVVDGERQKELSASKLQALVWTIVTLFAYGSVFGALLLDSGPEAVHKLPQIPLNLLVLMGLSVTTAAGAKGVTVAYKEQDRIDKKSGGAVTNAQGNPDLVKAQMLIWAFIGAVWYLLRVVTLINSGFEGLDFAEDPLLPDIDGALLVLMGAAQGAYIGDRLVSRDITKKPKLQEIRPSEGPAGTEITLLGENFGANQGQNFVRLDGTLVREGLVWGNLQIQKVTIPTECEAGSRVAVKVYCDGEYSDEEVVFTVTEEPTDPDPNT